MQRNGDNSLTMVKNYILISLLLSPFFLFSQGEFNQWRFGVHAGMDFNYAPPISISGSVNGYTDAVSISDSLGNLLFYSDGGSVWNMNNQVMPNGSGLYASFHCEQSVYSIKSLSDPDQYFLFYIPTYGYTPIIQQGLYFAVIDMKLNGGLGDIVNGMKNILVSGGENVAGWISGTRHRNNQDAWLVVRNVVPQTYLSYRVTPQGINPIPVVSPSLVQTTAPPPDCIGGSLKMSQDGKKVISCYPNDTITEYCHFDNETGIITPLFKFRSRYRNEYYNNKSTDFSRDSRFVYVDSHWINGVLPTIPSTLLIQYNATLTDSTQFMHDEIIIDSIFNYFLWGLQLAPDDKIYASIWTKDSVGVIHNPEIIGTGCNYQRYALGLNGNICQSLLPQCLQKYKAYLHYTGTGCMSDSMNFSGDIWPPADTIRWNFGDPASGGANISNLAAPSHLFSNPGSYTVEFYVRHNDNRTDTTWQTITIYPSPQPALGPDKTICNGNSVTFDAGFCAGCTYEWKNVGSGLIVGINQTFATGTAGIYSVNVTNGNGCTGKDTVQLITTPLPVVTNNPPLLKSICTGESTNIPLFGNEPGIMFHWTATLTSGNVTGFTADSGLVINQILINNGATAGVVTYHITPKIGDCAGTPVDYAVTVNVGDPVDVSIAASVNNVCAGIPVNFNATPTNPGVNPAYQWKVNAASAGLNSPVFTYLPANGDVVQCILTSSNTVCVSNNPATSNSITMVVIPLQPVSVVVSTSANPVCAGTSANFIAVPTNGGTIPQYQWKVNSLTVGANSPNYSYFPVNGDVITCTLTSYVLCPSGNPAMSNLVTMSVNPILPVGISIIASTNPFCSGSPVSFTATPMNGGVSPNYQWKVNGINAGSNNTLFTYNPLNGDVVTCSLASSESCTSGNPAQSNLITMVVNANMPAGITIVASSNPFCAGTTVTYTATPGNGGPSPTYQWIVNGTNAGTNSQVFAYNPANNDSIRCVMTSNLSCVTSNPASSGKIIMIASPAPNVTFATCFDTVTTISAKPFKLKGGIPLGGAFSGPGVNPVTGVFTPSTAGTGLKTILYTYTNVLSCSANMLKTILVQPNPTFTCGNNLIDIRDNKAYPTVQIGTQCWMKENLDYGLVIGDYSPQTDNCISEKYIHTSTFYQWDELMRYDPVPASQGLCPPGWHVPTSTEWEELIAMNNGPGQAGGYLTDTQLPGGFQSHQQGLLYLNNIWAFTTGLYAGSMYWTSTPSGTEKAVARGLNEYNLSVSLYEAARGNGFSVRCLKD